MKYVLCAFVLFGIVLPGFSQGFENQSGNAQKENIITAISIAGLKRTKHQVIEKYLLKFIGASAGDVDINDVYAIVKDTNLVEPVSVEITDGETKNGKTLTVTVQEKWSLFPVPFGGITNDKWAVGAAVIEANFLGLGDTAMLVGSFGSDSWMGSLMYMKSPKAAGEFGFSVMGMFMHQDAEHTDQTGNDILRRFNKLSINPGFSASYLLTNSITATLGVSYHYIALTDTDNAINAPDSGAQALGLSPRISFRTASWDGYLLSEKSVSIAYMYRFIFDDDDTQSVTLDAVFNYPLIPGFRITTRAGALFSTRAASPFFESASNPVVNLFSAKYSTLSYAAAAVGLEKYLFKFFLGNVSLAAGYQVAHSDGFLHNQFDHGPVATVQMYFSKVALPGMGLGAAYNVNKNVFQYAVNMGISF